MYDLSGSLGWNSHGIDFASLVGRTISSIEKTDYQLEMTMDNGDVIAMYHQQDCCESVWISDIEGDLDDLIGTPLLQAEESSNHEVGEYDESTTWTFYRMSTIKGSVVMRWCGTSNGYYSEAVDTVLVNKDYIED